MPSLADHATNIRKSSCLGLGKLKLSVPLSSQYGCDWTDEWVCFSPCRWCVRCSSGAPAGSFSTDTPVQSGWVARSVCSHTDLHAPVSWPRSCTHTLSRDSMSTVSEPLVGSSRSLSAAKRHKSIRKNSRRIYSAYQDQHHGWVRSLFVHLIHLTDLLSGSLSAFLSLSLSVSLFLSLCTAVIFLGLKWHPVGYTISHLVCH